MNLAIEKSYDKRFDETTTHLSLDMLVMRSTHLFIASNKWDEIYVELDDKIPERSLLHLPMVTQNIKVKLPDKITMETVKLLTELFPDKAGSLRKRFMTDGLVGEVIAPCVVK